MYGTLQQKFKNILQGASFIQNEALRPIKILDFFLKKKFSTPTKLTIQKSCF